MNEISYTNINELYSCVWYLFGRQIQWCKTGNLQFANAGHNPPLIKRANGEFEYLKTRAGFVLAGMEGMCYRAGEITLFHGDRVFLYTDGVTEATNIENELYGEDRLISFMNQNVNVDSVTLIPALKAKT